MIIAFLTESIFPNEIGGIQKHSYFLIKSLTKKKNIKIDIYHSHTEKNFKLHDYYTKSELSKINFIHVNYPKLFRFPGHYILSSYILSRRYYAQVHPKNYEIIYCQGFTGWYYIRKHPFESKIISNLHGLEMFQRNVDFKNLLANKLLKIPAKTIIKNSLNQISLGGILTELLYKNGAKCQSVYEIPNGISKSWISKKIKHKNYTLNSRIKFLFIGRYEKRKGIKELKHSLKKLINKYEFEFHFIGPIPDYLRITHDQIFYYGEVKDQNIIKTLLYNSDVIVCPSYSEGMPTVILEAMANHCAVLATNVGAISTIVTEANGILINDKVDLDELYYSIEKFILMERKILDKMKNHSLLSVKNYTWDKISESTSKVFKLMIEK